MSTYRDLQIYIHMYTLTDKQGNKEHILKHKHLLIEYEHPRATL